jgi:6-pyruvoyltetrahydropterin/6-carboxytetrahydropterin synthase
MKGKMASTEVLAVEIWKILDPLINGEGALLHCIRLEETENNFVEYYGE